MAQPSQGTFRAPETTVPRRGTFQLPDSDPETTESEQEYKDAEEGPSRARTHTSNSSPEPDTEEGPSGARTQHRSSSPEPRQVEGLGFFMGTVKTAVIQSRVSRVWSRCWISWNRVRPSVVYTVSRVCHG